MSRIRADQLVNRAGSGGPKFPHGVAEGFSVSGVVTATSYRGDGSQLTGIDASSLKDGNNVKVQAQPSGATVTGILTVTNNIDANNISGVNADFSGNATVQGNLTVNGTTTTIDTAVTAVDSLAVDGSVGIGTTNPTAKLSVFTGGVEDSFRIGTPSGSDTLIRLGSTGTDPDTHAVIKYDKEDNYLSLIVSGETHGGGGVLIANGGNVGIGVTDPSEKLEVRGGKIFVDGGGNRKITLDPGSNSTYDSRIDASHTLVFRSYVDAGVGVKTCTFNTNGHLLPGEDNGQDLGASNARWRNIYTGDLNLSNEGSANDVDGTWGQYTIQEGEDDLFLINRRTGKKYKFNLTEVD